MSRLWIWTSQHSITAHDNYRPKNREHACNLARPLLVAPGEKANISCHETPLSIASSTKKITVYLALRTDDLEYFLAFLRTPAGEDLSKDMEKSPLIGDWYAENTDYDNSSFRGP